MIGLFLILAFLATIPLANLMVVLFGFIPVGFGLYAPAGVLLAGLALVLRDLVHRFWGPRITSMTIVVGAGLSFLFAPPALAFASGAAFLLSELIDLAVYHPLAKRGFIRAVVVSSLVGNVVDSALFLWLAFGALTYLPGQIVAKCAMIAAAALVLAFFRRATLPHPRPQGETY